VPFVTFRKTSRSRKGSSRSWSRLEAKNERLGLGKNWKGFASVSSRTNFQTSRSRFGLERKGLVCIPSRSPFIQRSNNERFLFNINIQATGKDDHSNASQLYDTAGADDKEEFIVRSLMVI